MKNLLKLGQELFQSMIGFFHSVKKAETENVLDVELTEKKRVSKSPIVLAELIDNQNPERLIRIDRTNRGIILFIDGIQKTVPYHAEVSEYIKTQVQVWDYLFEKKQSLQKEHQELLGEYTRQRKFTWEKKELTGIDLDQHYEEIKELKDILNIKTWENQLFRYVVENIDSTMILNTIEDILQSKENQPMVELRKQA